MKADGTIIVDTEIETEGVEVGCEDIKNAVKKTSARVKDYGNSVQEWIDNYVKQMDTASSSTNKFKKKIETLLNELETLEKKGLYFGDEMFDSTYVDLQKANEELKNYKKQLVKPIEIPVEISSDSLQGQVDSLKSKLSTLGQQGLTFGDAEYDKTALALKRAEQALAEYKNELFKTEEQVAKEKAQQEALNQKLEETRQKEAAAAAEAARLSEIGRNARVSNVYVVKLREEIERLQARQKDLENAGLGPGYAEYDKNAARLKKMNAALQKYQAETKKATKSGKQFNKTVKDTGKSANRGRLSLGRMMVMSVSLSTVFRAITAVTSGLKEGIDNLAQYSDDTNKALSLLMSRLTQLKNAFATAFSPVIEFVAPALAKLISLLAEAVTWTGQLFSALAGKDTFTKAVKVEQDYAESLDKSKDKTDELKKSTEKMLAPFDELIQVQKTKKDTDDNELKPSDMFETVEVSNEMKDLAEDIKATFSSLFAPLKQSWDENGPLVLQSVKNAFAAAKQLALDVGASFMQVWNVEGYGKKITDDLLITFANLAQTVANLIEQFDKAWTSGDTGTNIIRHLGDIVLEVTGFFREASESIKNWAAKLDFSPLLKSFDGMLVAIRPIVGDVGDLLLWLLNKVLLPLAKWGAEQALPAVFDLIAAALKVVHSVIEALKPMGEWLWNNFLQPIGEWTGKVIIAALEKVVEWLTKFSDWVRNNQTVVENITLVVVAFFAAWKFVTFVSGILKMISMFTTLSTILSILGIDMMAIVSKLALGTLKFTLLTAAIAGVIAIVAILAKNWKNMSPTEKVISSILAAASAVAVLAVALGAVKGAAGAALVAGALAMGIAAATIAINAGKRAASTQGYSSSGYSSYPVSAYAAIPYNPPMLATGTVVPPRAGISYFGIGDNNHEPEVVSPLSTIEQALENVLSKNGLTGDGKEIRIDMYVKDRVFAQMVYEANNKEKQRVGVRMVSQNV